MGSSAVWFCVALLFLGPCSAGWAQAPPLPASSIAGRAASLRALAAEYALALAQLQSLAEEREARLRRGQGWRNADGGHGLQTPAVQAFFGSRSAGLTCFGPDGAEAWRFVASYQEPMPWGIYARPDGTRVTAGYEGARVTNLEIVFPDAGRVASWGSSVRLTYPGGTAFYAMASYRGQPMLQLSDSVSGAVRAGDPAVLADLAADFPGDYVVRILCSAARSGVSPGDDKALAAFAANWFRSLLGAPPVPVGEALDAAASSHAAYLIRNAVLPRLNALAATTPNVYLELHTERAGTPGFTGAGIWDRTLAAGYRNPVTETANFGSVTAAHDMASWFLSVFHRRPFLDPRTQAFGYAREVSTERPGEIVGIADWGFLSSGSPGCLIYPADGETLVPAAWAAQEAPDPFPGRAEGTGTPISVTIADPRYAGGTIELVDGSGAPVPLLAVTVRQEPDRYLEAAPEKALERGATYTVRYTCASGTISSSFTTAPPDPSELVLAELRAAMEGTVETRNPGFDVEAALRAGQARGELQAVADSDAERIVDRKYGFSLILPRGWRQVDRTWQEVALARGTATIGIQLHALGPGVSAEEVLATYASPLAYGVESTETVRMPHASGYRRVYGWQYSGKVVLYALVFGEFGMGIYGYGVTPELMEQIAASLRPD